MLVWMDLLKLKEIPILLVLCHQMAPHFGMVNLLNVTVKVVNISAYANPHLRSGNILRQIKILKIKRKLQHKVTAQFDK